jgi:very-short-patch-repair endonuclease
MATEPFHPLIRAHLMAEGVRPSFIQAQVRANRWSRLHDGYYLDEGLTDENRLRAERLTHIARAGAGSAFSHVTAARIHGLDLPNGANLGEWISVPAGLAHFFHPKLNVRRTRTLNPADIVFAEGIAVTSRARTVIDLAETLLIDDLEVVVESSLRGSDPCRPHVWCEGVLAELISLTSGGRQFRGAARLSQVLLRRPVGCRPTGSIAETRLLQALRSAGVSEVVRQPTLTISSVDRQYPDVFPDFIVPRRRLVLEVDGKHHRDADQHRKDLIRQNRLMKGFSVLRCTGLDALSNPTELVCEVLQSPRFESDGVMFDWTVGDRRVSGVGNLWSLRAVAPNV